MTLSEKDQIVPKPEDQRGGCTEEKDTQKKLKKQSHSM
jgi:hypothetical protein